MTTPSNDPLVGRTVAHYEVLARLGGGGMGVVYTARDTRLERLVALKFLPPQWSHDEDAKQRFVREARAASATDHRNICSIHDIATSDDGQLFIVMAYYPGPTLKQRLEQGPLPVEEALDIATQVADGLARAHAQGVVHRDVKPGNLILAEDGVRIVDFGLATFADALQLTVAGSTLGTAAYMSPEQVRGEAADARTDVWATGVILFQMLTGHVPFRGAYAEAIAHAIRHETPSSIRAERSEVPEDVEQLVFRALHKETAVRYASGRELARALRQVRGQTVPLDLRTEPVIVPRREVPPVRRRRVRAAVIAVGVVLLAVGGGAGWALMPSARVPIVVVPVANQTGDPALDPYRLALTQAIVQELTDSPHVRPMSWPRMLQTLRAFIATDAVGLSSGEVVQALRVGSTEPMLVRPTLVAEGKVWSVRVEIIDRRTSVALTTLESAGVAASVLRKDLAYRLMADAVALIQDHFDRRWIPTGASRRPPSAQLRTVEAAKAFADGLDAYEEQEYPAAYDAFQRAGVEDPSHPLAPAWASRAARAMRKDAAAVDAGNKAIALLTLQTPATDRLFVEAIAAEANRDPATVTARLEALIERFPDDPRWLFERAAFEDRQADSRQGWESATLLYHDVIDSDPGLIRAHLELCRLYNRLQDTPNAKESGLRAMSDSQRVKWQGLEALARLCLADALRQGEEAERAQAQEHAQQALQILERAGLRYNVPRALFYLGLAAWERGRVQEAADFYTRADVASTGGGNTILQPLVLANLAAVHESLGDPGLAFDSISRSAAMYETLGDQRRAARQQKNLATMKIRYGEKPDEGFREAVSVLEVLRARGDFEFEVVTLELIGDYHRIAGRYADASAELNKALQLAHQHNLTNRVTATRVALARLQYEEGRYEEARVALQAVVGSETASSAPEAWVALGRVQAKLGDFAESGKTLARVVADLARRDNQQLRPFLHLVLGELAFESDRLDEARQHFKTASAFWRDSFSLDAAVEAKAYLGLVEALSGRPAMARAEIQASLDRARVMGRIAQQMRCRVFLARVALIEGRAAAALSALNDVSGIDAAGLELRVQLHYWRGQALRRVGRNGDAETATARRLLDEWRTTLSAPSQSALAARRDIREMLH